jgi:hypothetical protein
MTNIKRVREIRCFNILNDYENRNMKSFEDTVKINDSAKKYIETGNFNHFLDLEYFLCCGK